MPIFFSWAPTEKPGKVRSTMKADSAALTSGLVGHGDDDEHIGVAGVGDEDLGAVQDVVLALLVQHGHGLLTPPASVPAPGSVRPKAPSHSPEHSLGRYFCF